MNRTATRCLLVAGLVLLGFTLLALAADPPAAAPAKGDQWEVQSQMSLEGMPMPMPPQKVVVCAPKEWKAPPGGADEKRKCTVSDFQMTGNKATWKTHCEGPPPMDGTGEITRDGANAFTGAIKLTSGEAAMTIKLTGKRLGDCDPK
ncbi:MAG TPA: DUF3617 family protein [Candidatus Polarisedimenticolia bacterium]|jgi:hypothetical protein|nr:DUF3617 family protein [Candidatus Polarisedimenticolia bacterium]